MRSSFDLPQTAGYTVDVVRAPKTRTRTQNKVLRGFFALFMALFIAASSLIAVPSQAKASWIDDSVRSVFCSSIYFNAKPDGVWGQPGTVKGKDLSKYQLTAFEKYGTSGMNWTVWVGPDSQEDMDGEGNMGGRQLVGLAGGKDDNAKLETWGDGKKPSDAPVFFNVDESCGDPINVAWSTVGNFIMMINGGVIYISSFIFQTAYETSSSIISAMEKTDDGKPGPITEIVSTLTDSFYLEFFNIMIMLAAIWMGYKGLVKRQSTELATGAIWMFGAAIVGMFMLANPLMVSNAVNTAVMSVSEAAVSTIAGASTKNLSGNDSNRLCYTEETGNGADADGNALKKSTRGVVRGMQCSLWESFLYTPWTIGQFGHVTGQTAENGINYIDSRGDKPGEYGHIANETHILEKAELPEKIDYGGRDVKADWAKLQLDSRVSHQVRKEGQSEQDLTIAQGRTMLEIASAETWRDSPNKIWAGQSSVNRVFTALIALISSVGAAIMIVIIAMEMIILQIGLVILVLLAPIFALVGVHPGFGRRVALMWVNTIAELALRRIVLSILLALMVTFYAVVLATSASAPWMVSMIMVVAISLGGIVYKSKIMSMFSGALNMGGAGSLPFANGDTANNLLKKGMGITGGIGKAALAGAVGGGVAAMTGAGVRAKMKNHTDEQFRQEFLNSKNGKDGDNGNSVTANNAKGGAGNRPGGLGSNFVGGAEKTGAPDAGFQDGSAYLGSAGERVEPEMAQFANDVEPLDGKPDDWSDDQWAQYQRGEINGAGERLNPWEATAAAGAGLGGLGAISADNIAREQKRLDRKGRVNEKLNGVPFTPTTHAAALQSIQDGRLRRAERVASFEKKFSGVRKPVDFVQGVGAGTKNYAGSLSNKALGVKKSVGDYLSTSRVGQAAAKQKAVASNAASAVQDKMQGAKSAVRDAHTAAKGAVPLYGAATVAVGSRMNALQEKRADSKQFRQDVKARAEEKRLAAAQEEREFKQFKKENMAAWKHQNKDNLKAAKPHLKEHQRSVQRQTRSAIKHGGVVQAAKQGHLSKSRALSASQALTDKAVRVQGTSISNTARDRMRSAPEAPSSSYRNAPAPAPQQAAPAPKSSTTRSAPAPAPQQAAPRQSAPQQAAPAPKSSTTRSAPAPKAERSAPVAKPSKAERRAASPRRQSPPAPPQSPSNSSRSAPWERDQNSNPQNNLGSKPDNSGGGRTPPWQR